MKLLFSLQVACTFGVLASFAVQSARGQTKTPDPTLLAKTKVSYADAEKIALRVAPSAAIKESELENEDGALRWSFDLLVPGSKKITEIGVDALTGKVIEDKVESAKDEADEAKEHHHKKQG